MRRLPVVALSLVLAAACGGGDTPSAPATAFTLQSSLTELSSTVSAAVADVPTVTVRNARGEAASGVLVRWTVVKGGGTVGSASSTTNASGLASSGGWTLGPQTGVQQLQASVSGSAPVTFTATATAVALIPARLTPVTSSATYTVATVAPQAPSVRVVDASGAPVGGVAVTFDVVSGGGTLASTTATSNGSGVATAGAWTLGTSSGTQTVRATATGLPAADISVSVKAAAPTTLAIVAGDGQSGIAGATVSQPPVVRVTDTYGNNVGNVPVTFTPGASSGSVTGGTVQTDAATGTAVVSSWTLGSGATQTLVASSSAMPGKSVTFRASIATSQFDINVRFVGDGGTDRQREAFTKAVSRWRRVITGDIGTTPLNVPVGQCASWIPAINESINDLVIYVRLAAIDGAGKVLGQASPCYVNSGNKLPIMGFFELDQDDLATLQSQGTLDDVVLHEMGHILGIGTLWSYERSLLVGAGSSDPYFSGVSSREQFASIGGNTYAGLSVPVENTGSAGTRDAHWRRTVFTNELMQGYAQPGGMPMSRVTIASLADLGYQVSFSGSDSFSFFPSMRTMPAGPAISLGDDVAPAALWSVTKSGAHRKVREARPRRLQPTDAVR